MHSAMGTSALNSPLSSIAIATPPSTSPPTANNNAVTESRLNRCTHRPDMADCATPDAPAARNCKQRQILAHPFAPHLLPAIHHRRWPQTLHPLRCLETQHPRRIRTRNRLLRCHSRDLATVRRRHGGDHGRGI